MEENQRKTLLDPDEKEGLIPDIQTQEELNEQEQNNIIEAEQWLFPTCRSVVRVLTSKFLRTLHEKMFGYVWKWAGQFRKTEKNLGIDPRRISVECRKLCDKAGYWLENDTYKHLEFCARIHHRLTMIHPFPNGNGRFARLYVDYLSHCRDQSRFSWGKNDLIENSEIREQYITSLRKADQGNIQPLMDFMESGET